MTANGTILPDYAAALHGVALHDASAAGRLWMHERDRAALLQRLSTNQIEVLYPGQGCRTVLCNHNGRIIDLLTVHVLDDQLLMVTSPQQYDTVTSLLRKNIFFNDKVRIAPAQQLLGQLTVYGPQLAPLLATLGFGKVLTRPLHSIVAGELAGVTVWAAPTQPLGGGGVSLYMPTAACTAVANLLLAAGATPLGDTAYDILRIEAGYGVYGRELSLDYIPLETGLLDAISFNKGCYVGQEILARMESRNRLAKQLCHLRLHSPTGAPLPAIEPAQPARLQVDGKEAGDLTSVTHSPRFGTLGLAYVRSAYSEPGTRVQIANSDFQGAVVTLGTAEAFNLAS